jgi:hypothetical protein
VSSLRGAFDRGELTLGPAQFRTLVSASWSCLQAARAGAAPPARSLAALRDSTVAVSGGSGNEVAAQLTALLDQATTLNASSVASRGGGGMWRVDARVVERACGAGGELSAQLLQALGPILQQQQ